MPACCWWRSAASSSRRSIAWPSLRRFAGLTVILVAGARRRHQRRHRVAVHARPARRPQYPRRLPAHGGRCRRLARRGGRGWRDHADGLAVARFRDQPRDCRRGVLERLGLARDSVNLALDGVPRGIDLSGGEDYLPDWKVSSEVHDLHIWAMSTNETALTAHLVRPGGSGDAFLHWSARSCRTGSRFTMRRCRSKSAATPASSRRRRWFNR